MYTKEQKLKFKEYIKTLVTEQKENRRNRKTVHIVGERTMPADEATWKHSSLRFKLNNNYIAYAFMRGKSSEWIVQHVERAYIKDQELYSKIIQKILDPYEQTVCVDSQ